MEREDRTKMTNQEKLVNTQEEAIECIKKNRPTSGYQMLNEALDMAVDALERWEPIEPEKISCDDGLTIRYFCPTCKRYLGQKGKHSVILFNKETFCQNTYCGQALKWEGEK